MQRRIANHHSARASIEFAVVVFLAGCAGPKIQPLPPLVRSDQVGPIGANRFFVPTGQVLTPAGRQVSLPGMRPQALALSPDRRLLATAGRNNSLVLIDPAIGQVLQTIPLSVISDDSGAPVSVPIVGTSAARSAVTNTAELSFTGLVFSPDGRRLFLSNVSGNVWVFPVNGGHVAVSPSVLPVPDARTPKQKSDIPTGLAVSADGKRLYVAGNLGGRLYELDAFTSTLLRSWDTGVAPYDVVLSGSKAYVSNLGGRFPRKGELTAPAGMGTTVLVDPVHYITQADRKSVV
jgi:DNA-binding beta-propeller fold protein YncE